MKKHIFLKIFLFLIVLGASEVQAQTISISINCSKFNLHRPKFNCERGFGFCFGNCKIDIKIPIMLFSKWQDVPPKHLAAFTPDLENGTVTIRFLQDLPRDAGFDGSLEIEEEELSNYLMEFSDEDATQLGIRSIQLLPGRYEVQPEKGTYGVVVIPATFVVAE